MLGLGIWVFWAAKWEVRVDRSMRVKPPHPTDQWVQQENGVALFALWLCGRTASQMRCGDPVARTWSGLDVEIARMVNAPKTHITNITVSIWAQTCQDQPNIE